MPDCIKQYNMDKLANIHVSINYLNIGKNLSWSRLYTSLNHSNYYCVIQLKSPCKHITPKIRRSLFRCEHKICEKNAH